MRGDRKCVVCGKNYQFCPHCGKDSSTETWRFLYCSDNCRKLFNVLSAYVGKQISADKAKEQLDQLVIPSLEQMKTGLKNNYEEIIVNTKIEIAEQEKEEQPEEFKRSFKRRKKKIVNED